MPDKPLTPRRPQERSPVTAAKHKFAAGAYVMLIGQSDETLFKVTRLLPDGGTGLQYRIKNEHEGYERVAVEPLLTAARR